MWVSSLRFQAKKIWTKPNLEFSRPSNILVPTWVVKAVYLNFLSSLWRVISETTLNWVKKPHLSHSWSNWNRHHKSTKFLREWLWLLSAQIWFLKWNIRRKKVPVWATRHRPLAPSIKSVTSVGWYNNKAKTEAVKDFLAHTLLLRKTSPRRPSEGCAISHRLKWDP